MILGIGIDLASIKEIEGILSDGEGFSKHGKAFLLHTYTDAERLEGEKAEEPYRYYSERFAAKEAVFKATGNLLPESFDFRYVETLNDENGKPYININERLRPYMEGAGVKSISISLSCVEEFAMASVIAEG